MVLCSCHFQHHSTLYRQQNFRQVQIESLYRQQNKCESKIEIWYGKGRKHCGKRRKCWLPAFSPYLTMFSKGLFLRIVKSYDCVVKDYVMSC